MGSAAEHPRLERAGEMQAAGDAREDQREIGGAEAGFGEDRVGGGALADGGGEFAAVVDQLADQGEQAAAAAGLGRWGWDWGFGHGGHEHNKNTSGPRMSRIYSAGSGVAALYPRARPMDCPDQLPGTRVHR